jgi:hypothetical protein
MKKKYKMKKKFLTSYIIHTNLIMPQKTYYLKFSSKEWFPSKLIKNIIQETDIR